MSIIQAARRRAENAHRGQNPKSFKEVKIGRYSSNGAGFQQVTPGFNGMKPPTRL